MRSLIEPLFEAALEAVLAGAASGALPAAFFGGIDGAIEGSSGARSACNDRFKILPTRFMLSSWRSWRAQSGPLPEIGDRRES